jgi:hypothetical protein
VSNAFVASRRGGLSRDRARSSRGDERGKADESGDFRLSTRREIDARGALETDVRGASATAAKEADRDRSSSPI